MSVFSVKMAVTCEKPLREIERVLSRPGMPASAVSIRKVTCFSISAGDSAGRRGVDLHLLVGDVGHGVDRQPGQRPSAERDDRRGRRDTTSQRCWIESARIRLIMLRSQSSCSASALPSSALSMNVLASRCVHRRSARP